MASNGDFALAGSSVYGGGVGRRAKARRNWLRVGFCVNVYVKMVFVLTLEGCLLRVHFSRHGVDTLGRGEVRQDAKSG